MNDSPTHAHHRYVIDFADFPLRREDLGSMWADADERQRTAWLREGVVPADYPDPVAADWPDLLSIVEERVKPVRLAQAREVRARYWWRFAERAPALYDATESLTHVIALSSVSSHFALGRTSASQIFGHTTNVFCFSDYAKIAVLQSRVHEVWARFFASSLEDRLRYTPSDCFEPFPFPVGGGKQDLLQHIGQKYFDARGTFMREHAIGLTRLYNRFIAPDDQDPAIIHLRDLHAEMDRAVLDAYGWTDLHPVAIHEREWDSEEGEKPAPWRLRWPEADRDEVMARLLDLNRRRKEEEAARDAPAPGATRRRAGRRAAPASAPLFADDV